MGPITWNQIVLRLFSEGRVATATEYQEIGGLSAGNQDWRTGAWKAKVVDLKVMSSFFRIASRRVDEKRKRGIEVGSS